MPWHMRVTRTPRAASMAGEMCAVRFTPGSYGAPVRLAVVHAAAVEFDLHIPECRSLKAKRSVVRPLVEGLRRRYHVAAAEVGHHDQWQRTSVGVATVASTEGHVCEILDEVERFVWSRPEVQVLSSTRSWLDES